MSEDEQTDDNSPIGLLKQKVGHIYGAAAQRYIQEAVDICTADIRKWQKENAELGEELATAKSRAIDLAQSMWRVITSVWPEYKDIKPDDLKANIGEKVADLRRMYDAQKDEIFGLRRELALMAGESLTLSDALVNFFDQRSQWSERSFGPRDRYGGGTRVVKHIRKELKEIEAKPDDLEEWIDIILLAMDGAWRSAGADGKAFVEKLHEKQMVNFHRTWPDWRTLAPDQVAEHVRAPGEAPKPDEVPYEVDRIWSLIEEFEEQHPFTGEDGGSNDRALLFNLISQRFTPKE